MIVLLFLISVKNPIDFAKSFEQKGEYANALRVYSILYQKDRSEKIYKKINEMYEKIKPEGVNNVVRIMIMRGDTIGAIEKMKEAVRIVNKIYPIRMKIIKSIADGFSVLKRGHILLEFTQIYDFFKIARKYYREKKNTIYLNILKQISMDIVYVAVPVDSVEKHIGKISQYLPVETRRKIVDYIEKKENGEKIKEYIIKEDYKQALELSRNPLDRGYIFILENKPEEAVLELKKALEKGEVGATSAYILLRSNYGINQMIPLIKYYYGEKNIPNPDSSLSGFFLFEMGRKLSIEIKGDSLILPYLYYDMYINKKQKEYIDSLILRYPLSPPAILGRNITGR